MKVTHIMTAHASCVAPDNTLVEAAGLMRKLDVGALPVCEIDRLAGMVTDRDIVLRGVADGRDASTTTVRDVMSQGAFFVYGDQSVEDAAELMEQKQVRRLPVLNREKKLIGIVSLGDVAVNSNPAFTGLALKEVSLSARQRMDDQSPRMLVRMDGTNGRRPARSATRSPQRATRGRGSSSRRGGKQAARKTSRTPRKTASRGRRAGARAKR